MLPRSDWSRGPKISIYVGLSLEDCPQCHSVADSKIFQTWPRIAGQLIFDAFTMNGGTKTRIGAIRLNAPPPAAATMPLWSKLMGPSHKASAQRAHAAFNPPRILTYDYARLSDALDSVYGGNKKRVQTGNPLQGIGWWGTKELQQDGPSTQSVSIFRQFAVYQLPRKKRLGPLLVEEDDADERLSNIQNYPPMMRAFGLVLDGEIILSLGSSLPPNGVLAVELVNNPFPVEPITISYLWSAYDTLRVGSELFAAMASAPDDTTRRHGLYGLDRPGTRIVQFPLDTAIDGIMKAAMRQNQSGTGRRLAATGTLLQPPALQSIGYSVYHEQIAPDLQGTSAKAARLHTQSRSLASAKLHDEAPIVYIDQADKGYRTDVWWSRTKRWHSLSERQLSLTDPLGEHLDLNRLGQTESFSSLGLSAASDGSPKSSQRLFAWLGWSVNIGRPDNPVDGAGRPVAASRSAAKAWVRENVRDETLAWLRFGDWYGFRSRVVDICGNSLTLSEAGTVAAHTPGSDIAPIRFMRYDPLSSPIVIHHGALTNGAKPLLMVVYSTKGGSDRTARSIHPPKTTPPLLEFHGIYDTLNDEQSYEMMLLAAKRRGGAATMTVADFKPYLADPIVNGVNVIVDNGAKTVSLGTVGFDGGLLREVGHGIDLVLETGASSASIDDGTISVSLPIGRSCRVRLASACSTANRDLLAFADEVDGPLSPFPERELILLHPTPTPLALPVMVDPQIGRRSFKNTQINFYDPGLQVDLPTTGKIAFRASWTESFDQPGTPDWTRQDHSVVIVHQNLDLPPTDPMAFAASLETSKAKMGLHDGGPRAINDGGIFVTTPSETTTYDLKDTYGRVMTIEPAAHSRHADFFPAATDTVPSIVRPAIGATAQIIVPATLNPTAPRIAFILPTFARSRRHLPHHVIEQQTHGWGLRLFFERDWREEWKLALIFDRATTGPMAYTASAADPLVRSTRRLPRLGLRDVLAPSVSALRLPTTDKYAPDAPATEFDEVDIVYVDIGYDLDKDLRFADVVLRPPAGQYKPFIRFALARYNQNAIEGAELSRCVMADWAQPSPNRNVLLSHDSSGYTVTVIADAVDGDAKSTRTRFFAHVEYSEHHAEGEYGWSTVPDSLVELEASDGQLPTWVAKLKMRSWTLLGRRRVVVREAMEMPGVADQGPDKKILRLMSFDIVPL